MTTTPDPVTVMHCLRCGAVDAGAPARCRRCGNHALDRIEVPGRGRLVTWTVVRRPAGAFAHRDAFAVALVDLYTGPRLTGNLEGWEREPPLGAAVRVTGEIDGVPLFAVETASEAPVPMSGDTLPEGHAADARSAALGARPHEQR